MDSLIGTDNFDVRSRDQAFASSFPYTLPTLDSEQTSPCSTAVLSGFVLFSDLSIALFLTLRINLQGWVVCVIACAFCGKFFGCFAAARWTGFTNRESAGVGFLMSSKGLIELIILNQGLSVGIINETGEFPSYELESTRGKLIAV